MNYGASIFDQLTCNTVANQTSHIIRYNILVNPTGKPRKFRGVDWVVELLNLCTKHIYGSKGSNYTKQRILTESPLVLIFRSSHSNFERNFRLPGLTTRHAPKNMKDMYNRLQAYMAEHDVYKVVPGRKSKRLIADHISNGIGTILKEAAKYRTMPFNELLTADSEDDNLEMEITADDISIDFDEDI